MPPDSSGDPVLLAAAADRLALARAEVFDASNELMDHYLDAGDNPTQVAVDTLTDHAADTLRALADGLADLIGALQTAASGPAETDRTARRDETDRTVRRDLDGLAGRRNLDGLGGRW